jgi:hypothetical protein
MEVEIKYKVWLALVFLLLSILILTFTPGPW